MQDDRNNIATITRHSRLNVKDKDTKRLIKFILFDLLFIFVMIIRIRYRSNRLMRYDKNEWINDLDRDRRRQHSGNLLTIIKRISVSREHCV